jgi:hypothetical protein
MDRVLEVARLAELAMSRAETTTSESMVCQQLAEMQAEMRRLSIKVDKTMTTMITPRSPTPERRVHFTRDESPAPRATSSMTYNRQGGRSVSNTVQRQHIYSSPRQNDDRYARQPGRSQSPVQCTRCARNHGKTAFCPARDPTKVCHYCHKPGHFQAACFSAPNNIDGVASQLPTVGSLRRRNSRAEDAANHQYQTPLRNPFLKTLNMEIICSSKFTEN